MKFRDLSTLIDRTRTDNDERQKNFDILDSDKALQCIESLTRTNVSDLSRDYADQLRGPILQLQEELNARFVEREELIEMALACFIAHLPMIALGMPGTAKSHIFRTISYGLGLQDKKLKIEQLSQKMDEIAESENRKTQASTTKTRRYFEYLVTRFTTPEELLGPADLPLMIKKAVFYRRTSGLLPEASLAFIDEIFKANSAILNALLSIIQEQLFYNAGLPTKVPLCMVFGASNEPPQEKELGALYDRFPVRVACLPIDDTYNNSMELLDKAMDHRSKELFPEDHKKNEKDIMEGMPRVATVNHFRMLHRIIFVSYQKDERFLKAFHDTFRSLRREFEISDRSFFKLYILARALGFLRGHERLEASELDVFKYCFHDMEAAAPLADAVQERIRRYRSLVGSAA